jgi:hypothetical protein
MNTTISVPIFKTFWQAKIWNRDSKIYRCLCVDTLPILFVQASKTTECVVVCISSHLMFYPLSSRVTAFSLYSLRIALFIYATHIILEYQMYSRTHCSRNVSLREYMPQMVHQWPPRDDSDSARVRCSIFMQPSPVLLYFIEKQKIVFVSWYTGNLFLYVAK